MAGTHVTFFTIDIALIAHMFVTPSKGIYVQNNAWRFFRTLKVVAFTRFLQNL